MMITVDDLNYDAISWLGGQVPGLTPNIDRLKVQGLHFTQAYNTHSRCAPSRGSMMTGLYQDRYADRPGTASTTLKDGLTPLPALLKQTSGYRTGVLGKETHYKPADRYDWDVVHPMADVGVGRHPGLYHQAADEFVKKAKSDGVPFFLSANTHDPHRPFAGAAGERKSLKRRFDKETKHRTDNPTFHLPPEIDQFKPEDVTVPGFLPDLPDIREEISWYLNSAYRCDLFVGRMLQVLDDHDLADNTLVVFLSDNGIHFPFAKSNCYMTSVRTPLILRWPDKINPDSVSDSIVSTVDLMPTILDAAGRPDSHRMDGHALTGLYQDQELELRDAAFVSINAKGKSRFEMRSLIGKRYSYVYNHFSDGKNQFNDGNYPGERSLKAMERAARTDPEIKARLDFMYCRTREEVYDLEKDPHALHNLIDSPAVQSDLAHLRSQMSAVLTQNDDPFAGAYKGFLSQM